MTESSARDLEAALRSFGALPITAESLASQELRGRVCAFVDEMRRHAWPPERVLATVKGIAREAGLPASTLNLGGTRLESREALVEQVVKWCIEHYYTPGGGPDGADATGAPRAI